MACKGKDELFAHPSLTLQFLRSRNKSGIETGPSCFDFADWQHPYVNIFKHIKVEEWKRSSKVGDVSTYMVMYGTLCFKIF